jgi:hypothetical protein
VRAAIPVLCFHVLNPRPLEFEMTIAFFAVMVIATLHVVFLLCVEALKVDDAIIANPVGIGVVFMLLQGSFVSE